MNYELRTGIEILLSSRYWEFIDNFMLFLEEISELTEKDFYKKYGKRGFINLKFEKVRFQLQFKTIPGKVIFTNLERV